MNSKLIVKIEKYKVVSFDVFDTLVERDVELPKDIFRLTGKTVLGDGDEFVLKRIEAEHKVRERSESGEVTLIQIYDELKSEYGDKTEMLMNEEIAQEIRSCSAKTSMLEAYKTAIASCFKVFIVSDMYLPSSVIGSILSNCGITGYEKIYVSNEYDCNKISGELFKKVLAENDLSGKDLLHIGDSIKADYLGARKAGITSCLIRRKGRIKRFLNR